MATLSSTLAWKIPWTEEPGRLQSMGVAKSWTRLRDFTFTFFSFSAIRVVSSAYLRLLILLPAILIPACVSSSPAFLMRYSAYKLNKQGDNVQPDVLLFLFGSSLLFHEAETSLMVQMVKCLPTMWETWIRSLGW